MDFVENLLPYVILSMYIVSGARDSTMLFLVALALLGHPETGTFKIDDAGGTVVYCINMSD
jgi:hypothetical protein